MRDAAGLLVVDEAQHLGVRALDGLRGIHDAAGVGVALLGGDPLWTRMVGGRTGAAFAQLHSRVGRAVRLGRPSDGDVDAVLAAWSLRGKRMRAVARRIASRPGALRGLTKAIRYAHLMAEGPGRVTAAHVSAAWKEMGG